MPRIYGINAEKSNTPDDVSLADYYKGFAEVQRELNFSLRIFSLNYDLCVERLERLCSPGFRVETGFDGSGPRHVWDWERFEDNDIGPSPPEVYLYKLHGSINWKRNEATHDLFLVEQTEGIEPDKMEVIFGRDFKLEAADPYLFYTYEFRKFSLLTRLIVSIGYGFGDSHINKMLSQALRNDVSRRLLVISNCSDDESQQMKQREVVEKLSAKDEQIIVNKGTSKEFLEIPNLGKTLSELIPKAPDDPF
jgi:SIR2-like domain